MIFWRRGSTLDPDLDLLWCIKNFVINIQWSGEMGSTIDPDPDPLFGLQLFDLNLGSTPSLLQSHLCLTLGDGRSTLIWIQLQIHIWVVTFYLNLGSTPSLAPIQSMYHLRSCVCGVNSRSGSKSISTYYP